MEAVEVALGTAALVVMLGYVFNERWTAGNRPAVDNFLSASAAAKAVLRDSDAEWDALRPLLRVEPDAALARLHDRFRAVGAAPVPAADAGGGLARRRPRRWRPIAAGGSATRARGLEGWGGRRPGELSLGMARLAALARALAVEPELLVLGEPFASLNAVTAARLLELAASLLAGRGATAVLVRGC